MLATVDDGRRMLVEALIGTPDVPRPRDGGRVQVRYAFGDDQPSSRPDAGADDVVVSLAAPALRAMTIIDVPAPDSSDPGPARPAR